MIEELNYESFRSYGFKFDKPNRLFLLVHPGWDYKYGEEVLPQWKKTLDEIASDDNFGLVVVEGYGTDNIITHNCLRTIFGKDIVPAANKERLITLDKQKEYNDEIKCWTKELSQKFEGRFFLYNRKSFIPNSGHYKTLILNSVGNPNPVSSTDSEETYDFLQIDSYGMYPSQCVATQKDRFPCTSLQENFCYGQAHDIRRND